MVKILIMDDEPALRNIVYNIVKPLGHTMFTAEDGKQAIEIAKREIPDLALLDMRVPDMDGLEVLQELRKLNSNVRAIMLSGFGDVETAVHTLKQGAFDYLSKPFKVDEVLNVVNKAIASLPQGAAHSVAAPAAAAAMPTPAPAPAPVPAAVSAPAAKAPAPAPAKPASPKKKLPIPLLAGGAVILIAVLGFILKGSMGGGGVTEFSIPYSNPIGMSWVKPNLWVSDWVVGNIYQHSDDAKLSIASVYKTANAQPTGLTFDGESLWSCNSMEKRIYKHKLDKNLTIEAIYATPNASPAGLYFDGANLLVLDTNAAKIYKHKMDETLSVVGIYDSPAVNPCGIFRDGEYYYIGDYKTSKVYKVAAKDFTVSEVYMIKHFADAKYKLASITWDGQNIWVSADGVDKIFKMSFSALKPIKF